MPRETKSEVIAKVEKLLRLAKSSNQHEAELAAEMASKLMTKYQIESADIEAASIKSGEDPIATMYYVVPNLKMKLHWVVILGHACAVLYDGTVLTGPMLHRTAFTFVGFRSEITLMKALFEHLYALMAWYCRN